MANRKIIQSLRAAELLRKFLDGSLSVIEGQELQQWVENDPGKIKLMNELTNPGDIEDQLAVYETADVEKGWQNVQNKLRKDRTIKIGFPVIIRWAAAASVLLVMITLIYFAKTKQQEKAILSEKLQKQNIKPATDKATLTLIDGTVIVLDSTTNGQIASEKEYSIINSNGLVTYKAGSGNDSANIIYNTINVPFRGKYQVVLSDGSKVWLNAGSSLHFPVMFGKERKVELRGEGYFEINKDKKPFIVEVDGAYIKVLGTHFNIQAYAGNEIKTTLLEGKVQLSHDETAKILTPGQQGVFRENNIVITKVDTTEEVAWKNNWFIFNKKPLKEVMAQLSRWYGVQVEFDRQFTGEKYFTGEIKRNVSLDEFINMMELTGIASFRVNNNKVTVLPHIPGL